MSTDSGPSMWHKAQLKTWRKTQKSQLLLPRKQFYTRLAIRLEISLQSWAEITKGDWKLIAFSLYFFECKDYEGNLFSVKEKFNIALPDFLDLIHTLSAVPKVHSLCVQVLT